jgi:L-threonylcarbamoyladenylate synthase
MSKKISLLEAGEKLARGAVGIIPTDTIYGIVASAFNKEAVSRVYVTKGRRPKKSSIILISTPEDVERFGCKMTSGLSEKLASYWPGPVSVVLETNRDDLKYLHRGAYTFAFRIPNDQRLQEMLKISGPIIAPSANPEGLTPAKNIEEAEKYFGEKVDFFVDGGEMDGEASAIVSFEDSIAKVLRSNSYFEGLKNA